MGWRQQRKIEVLEYWGFEMLGVVIAALVVFALGLGRILFQGPSVEPLDLRQATIAAECLGSRGEIAANTPLTLLTLRRDDPQHAYVLPQPLLELSFIATGPVVIEGLTPALRAAIEEKKTDKLDAGTILSLHAADRRTRAFRRCG
jgi:hypothetical protein